MEQISLTAGREGERVVQILTDLMKNNKEFQIMITVPAGSIKNDETKLGETMNETAWGTIPDVDVLLFVIEATSDNIGKGDSLVLEKIKEKNKKTILVINKIDLIEKEKLLKLIDMYSKEYNFEAIIPVSALKKLKIL